MQDISLNTCLRFFNMKQEFTVKDVQKTYRRLVKKYHPDLNKSIPCKYTINQISYMRDKLVEFVNNGRYRSTINEIRKEFRIYDNIFEFRA